ncbi:MAG TPA: 23S rRNA (guanosine(2251)-2'-O)-methyltransferase RlmB [Candidatus Excrementavichristensenella intestinipullorum]|nr:23S rRNA (guanosine(2251)-2'-O)-methyltransferase RlmB [Candidatus Excrementavichristensenella intestinipullorum]
MAYDKKPGSGSGKSYGPRDGIDASAPQGDQVQRWEYTGGGRFFQRWENKASGGGERRGRDQDRWTRRGDKPRESGARGQGRFDGRREENRAHDGSGWDRNRWDRRREEGRHYPSEEGAPRRAAPPRGPIPPARQVEPPRPIEPSRAAFDALSPEEEERPENLLVGRNPIREALKADRPIEKMLVAQGDLTGSAREIIAMARERRVVIQYVDRSRLDQVCKGHQGMLAFASAAAYSTLEDILALAAQRDEDPLVVVLDGVTDPHNLGAIIRSCECMGAHGVIVPERRAAGLGPAAVKASAGALSYIKVARVVNLARTLDELKRAGLWVTGAAVDGADAAQVSLTGPAALVIGSEGEGLSHLVRQKCDQLVRLPMYGHIQSLNASVAAGILLYEAARARHA